MEKTKTLLPRIALVTHDMSDVGGLTSMVAFLLRILRQSGRYQPDVFALATSANDEASVRLRSPRTWFRGISVRRVKRHDLEYIHVGAWGSELEFQRYKPRRRLSALLKSYDLIQFVVGSPPWVCSAANAKSPIVLWTATTTRADRESKVRSLSGVRRAWSRLMIRLSDRYEKKGLQRADAVLALSNYTLSSVRAMAISEEPVLAMCGIDTTLFRPAKELAKDGYILCVARFSDPRKNVRLLLESYAAVLRKLPNAPDLLLVGELPTLETRQALVALGLSAKVRLSEPKRGEDLAEVYRGARLFVLSSNEEGLAIVILEAMASGLPVVSTDCGGPATAIRHGETGYLVPVADAVALSDTMARLLDNYALSEDLGRAGRKVAESQFSFEATGRVFLEKYDRLLGARGSPGS